jgi:hypothetical protein
MTDDLRALLESVAEGRIAPGRAAQLIDELPSESLTEAPTETLTETPAETPSRAVAAAVAEVAELAEAPAASAESAAPTAPTGPTAPAGPAGPTGPTAPSAPAAAGPPPTDTADSGVERVRITASARPVRLVGDHTVDTVAVDGPHSVRREGGTIRVDATPLGGTAADVAGSYRYERKTGFSRWLGQSSLVGVPLTVRVHPSLAAEAEVMAGSLEIVGMSGPVTFSVTAGTVRARDCAGPFTGSVRAGSARLEIRPTAGHSLVRVESGSLDLRLLPGSDVRVTGRVDLGEIKVWAADGTQRIANREELKDIVVGAGSGTFELEVAMGSAKVRLP